MLLNANFRRLLIEVSQSLGHSLTCGKKSLRVLARQKGMAPSIVAYADRAVARVKRKRSAMIIRGVNVNKAITAAAELKHGGNRRGDYAIHAIVDSTIRTGFSLIPTVRENGLSKTDH